MKMLRICYIADAGSIHTQRWVNYFAGKGHRVHIITGRLGEGYSEGIQLHLLTSLLPPHWKNSGYINTLLWFVQVRRLINRIKPDIIDAHYITINGYLGALSGFHPLVLTAWGSDVLIHPKRNFFFKAITKYALKRADMVICDSQIVRKELIKLGTKPEKLRLIFWGVDTQQFNPQQQDEELRGKLHVSGYRTVICIRSLTPVYNVEMLVKAIPLVLKQAPETTFVIAGDGEQREYLGNLVKSLGVLDSVRFVGWLPHDELPKYLASSDIYVSTSLSDSTSLSLQEAMACEVVPVVTDLPANREWITDNENGFIVPISDIQTLAQKIIYLLRNEEVRRKFGKLGREIIQERAEYEKEMGKMGKVYQEALKKL